MSQDPQNDATGERPSAAEQQDAWAAVNFLQSEAHMQDEVLRSQQVQLYGLGSLAFTIILGVVGFLVNQQQWAVLLVLPLVAVFVWLLGLRLGYEIFAAGVHRLRVEQLLAERVHALDQGLCFVPWDEAGGRVLRRSLVQRAVFAGYGLVGLTMSVVPFIVVWIEAEDLRWAVLVGGTIEAALVGVALLATQELRRAWRTLSDAYDGASQARSDG